jgi:hypothetical protein
MQRTFQNPMRHKISSALPGLEKRHQRLPTMVGGSVHKNIHKRPEFPSYTASSGSGRETSPSVPAVPDSVPPFVPLAASGNGYVVVALNQDF